MNIFEKNFLPDNTFEKKDNFYKNIEATVAKLKKEYDYYEELHDFINYLGSIEKIFLQTKEENWADEKLKEEIIEIDIQLMAIDSNINQSVFQNIHNDFKITCETLKKISETAEKLKTKYINCSECVVFIEYLRDFYMLFKEAKEENWTLKQKEEQVIVLKMKLLANDGVPPLQDLQNIYQEFKNDLTKN